MSDYRLPGPSSGAPGAPSDPQRDSRHPDSQHLVQLSTYAGGGLGVLVFIWGFLDWESTGGLSNGLSGFATVGGAPIALALAAGLLALARTVEKKDVSLTPAALAAAGALITFGVLVSHGDGVSVEIGVILSLITLIVQAGVLGYGWSLSTGRMSAPAPRPRAAQTPWQPVNPGGYAQSPQQWAAGSGSQPGYRPPGYGPPPSYGAPTNYGQQGGYGQQPGYPPPVNYGQQPGWAQPAPEQPAPQQQGPQQGAGHDFGATQNFGRGETAQPRRYEPASPPPQSAPADDVTRSFSVPEPDEERPDH